ncbi:hypothetical protein Pelo_3594 [Pelomyxa schiedti]|nr:hypothetical protein Pelo_3594 [Pelomyxa schiedti]
MGTRSHSEKERLVWLSRLIWDQIVSPGWLDHDNKRHKLGKARDKTRVLSHVATLFSLAEATSPLLVGLICNRVLRFGVGVGVVDEDVAESRASSHNCNCRWLYVGTYRAIMIAASVPSASCVQWILDHRRQIRPKDPRVNWLGNLQLGANLGHQEEEAGTGTTTIATTATISRGIQRGVYHWRTSGHVKSPLPKHKVRRGALVDK